MEMAGLFYYESAQSWFQRYGTTLIETLNRIDVPSATDQATITAIAFLVTIAGTSAWSLVASLLHSMLALRPAGVDAIGLQHQVLFRNTAGALGTMLDLVKVQFAWTKVKAQGSWDRTILLAIDGVSSPLDQSLLRGSRIGGIVLFLLQVSSTVADLLLPRTETTVSKLHSSTRPPTTPAKQGTMH
ncbi:hypothetical protein SUNI508_09547 [Seiridium unicorne]|uniref:Uncharacterized protein n=1 Tax=Seiridium unicorne TaxID=138068 RepID=A0ABR2UQ14_9PEZI